MPAERLRELEGDERHERAAETDAEIGEPHRASARRVEPAREQHLIRQRTAEDVPERVEQVEEVESRQRADRAEADQRDAGHQDADDHQPPRPDPIDEPAGGEAEQRADDELADRVARRDLCARPAEVAHHEVVEEGQAVQREPDDREERQEGRRGDLDLGAADLLRALVYGGGHVVWAKASRRARVWRTRRSRQYCSRGEQNHQGTLMEQRREFIRRLAVLGAAAPVAAGDRDRPRARHDARRVRRLPRRSARGVGTHRREARRSRARRTSPRERCTPRCPSSSRRRPPPSGKTTPTSRRSAGCSPASRPGSSSAPDAIAEGRLRARFAASRGRRCARATDPASPDLLNFTRGRQPLVDAAFLAHAIVRAPTELLGKLDAGDAPATRRRAALDARRSSRRSATGCCSARWSKRRSAAWASRGIALRVDYAVRQHQQWYKGDGMYGDGPTLHMDYYNSFVIHPMLLDVLRRHVGARPRSGSRSRPTPSIARAAVCGDPGAARSRPKGPFRRSAARSPTAAARSSCSARWRCGTSCRRGCGRPRSAAR